MRKLLASLALGLGLLAGSAAALAQAPATAARGQRRRSRRAAPRPPPPRPAAAAAAPAAATAAAAPAPIPNKGDTAWMTVATALVILMTIPGLALFYGGLVRSKNMLSVLMQVFVVTCADLRAVGPLRLQRGVHRRQSVLRRLRQAVPAGHHAATRSLPPSARAW